MNLKSWDQHGNVTRIAQDTVAYLTGPRQQCACVTFADGHRDLMYTNGDGEGLWSNGHQVTGTCQFRASSWGSFRAKLVRYFSTAGM
jgi:hypothetical protein